MRGLFEFLVIEIIYYEGFESFKYQINYFFKENFYLDRLRFLGSFSGFVFWGVGYWSRFGSQVFGRQRERDGRGVFVQMIVFYFEVYYVFFQGYWFLGWYQMCLNGDRNVVILQQFFYFERGGGLFQRIFILSLYLGWKI